MTISIQLEPNEVEQVLAAVGQEKINDRIALWMKIREQAVVQLQAQSAAAPAPTMDVHPAD